MTVKTAEWQKGGRGRTEREINWIGSGFEGRGESEVRGKKEENLERDKRNPSDEQIKQTNKKKHREGDDVTEEEECEKKRRATWGWGVTIRSAFD